MTGQLSIHHREHSYSDRWIAYCDMHAIPYRVVNCLDSGIMKQIASSAGLLWHWDQADPREQLVARHVIKAAEAMGVTVFPNTSTCWHFDDKIAQKYLLEAIDAPLVPTYVFYDFKEALHWIDRASFPKVFKLRKGAGSSNVKLVHSVREARALAKRAFSTGFPPIPHYGRDAMPLIRYKVGDRGSINTGLDNCPCGRKLPEISRIEGRANDVLVAPDGRRIFWLNPVFYGLPVREAQIVQEALDRLMVRYVPAPGFSSATERSIIERLYARMGKVEVAMERVDAVPRGANGKFRAVISNLSSKEREFRKSVS